LISAAEQVARVNLKILVDGETLTLGAWAVKKFSPFPRGRTQGGEGGETGCGSPHVSSCSRTTDESSQLAVIHGEG
jgi:hypothetical protein